MSGAYRASESVFEAPAGIRKKITAREESTMKNIKELYGYSIKTDGRESYIKERGQKTPIVLVQGDAEKDQALCAELLRDLAKWALEQAEIIEDMEGIKAAPKRYLDKTYRAEIVSVERFELDTEGMTAAEILNYYRNLYHAESMATERGILANAINDFFNQMNAGRKERR
jgi:hypothetical protein